LVVSKVVQKVRKLAASSAYYSVEMKELSLVGMSVVWRGSALVGQRALCSGRSLVGRLVAATAEEKLA
jgi:hypothetical protein